MSTNPQQTREVMTLALDFINKLTMLHRNEFGHITSEVGADLSLTLEMFISCQKDIERQTKIRERFIDCLELTKGKLVPPIHQW